VQAESIFADSSEMKDTSTPSEQELPVQRAHDSVEVNTVDKATDAIGDPSKDFDHTIDAENMNADEPDCTLDNVEVNTVDKANDAYGHPSQDSDDRIVQRIAMLRGLILFMTVPKQIMQMLSRQNQLLMIMLNRMMYPQILIKAYKKNCQ
jgi:hypothetical protein